MVFGDSPACDTGDATSGPAIGGTGGASNGGPGAVGGTSGPSGPANGGAGASGGSSGDVFAGNGGNGSEAAVVPVHLAEMRYSIAVVRTSADCFEAGG